MYFSAYIFSQIGAYEAVHKRTLHICSKLETLSVPAIERNPWCIQTAKC